MIPLLEILSPGHEIEPMHLLSLTSLLLILVILLWLTTPSSPWVETFQSQPLPLPPSASPTQLTPSSPPPPRREDIIPETTLSSTSIAATSLGQQSTFLRDLREIVRREIHSLRNTPVRPI